MDSRDLASIGSSVAALVKRFQAQGDKRPLSVIADEILATSGLGAIDARQQIISLRRRAATARRASRASLAGKARFT